MAKLEMARLIWPDGLLVACQLWPPPVIDGVTERIEYWRPTWGGKLLGAFKICPDGPGVQLPDMPFRWPVVPVANWPDLDVWYTATVGELVDDIYFDTSCVLHLLRPERNMRKPKNGVERVSRRIAHRVIWADRANGHLVTDPLHRRVFTSYGDALDYVRKMERRKSGLPNAVTDGEPM